MSQVLRSIGTPQVQIHFCIKKVEADFPENKDSQEYRLACMPNMVELHWTIHHPNYQRTNDYRAVTCQSCKVTDAYKQAAGVA